ncbi:radical SAM protein [Clostridium sp. P21]|uniref:Radical SAM protein n=1 Tax=Clostridium muellerianum TaxID=2716538 RepID=A0A7Y0EFF4_9CLOT|nr:radical SAM protein [Clostridium muellerianum]NMM61480.1 radical SAM protein [Clostridium muellerianum]
MNKIYDFETGVQLWQHCNFNCSFCVGAQSDVPKDWSMYNEKLIKLEEFFNSTGKWNISFLGGEPLINPKLIDLCKRLMTKGHGINLITNGSILFSDVFTKDELKEVNYITLSYHPIHEENSYYNNIFINNIKFLVKHKINSEIVYVAAPDRLNRIEKIKAYFESLGSKFRLMALQGEHGGKNYPYSYKQDELEMLCDNTDYLGSLYLLKHGHYTPTFKKCRSGYNRFNMFLSDGKITPCEQLNNIELFNFLKDDISDFKHRIYNEPKECLSKKCVCSFYMEQEEFMRNYDMDNKSNFKMWEKLCISSNEVIQYWEKNEYYFTEKIKKKIRGSNIFLWGAGIHTDKLLTLLKNEKFNMKNIKGIIDSNPHKDGMKIFDIPVLYKENFFNNINDCSDIIISSRAFESEIYNEIKSKVSYGINIVRLYDTNEIVPL